MKQVLNSATAKAVVELKTMVNDVREALITALTVKVGKLTHAQEREVLALVLSPTGEEKTAFVSKRVELIIGELVSDAAAKIDKPAKKRGRPAKSEQTNEH